ncbi:spindle and kinetochore-associated protein [Salix suchowensis]|nr:spindle and kinetochore-associated protein [Salix suchowensis]
MDVKQAGSSLDSLISSFNTRIAELQELVIARNMYPASSVTDLKAVDAALKAMELQKLIEASLRQQKKLQSMSVHVPERTTFSNSEINNRSILPEASNQLPGFGPLKPEEEPVVTHKEKKGRSSPPLWHITSAELDSLSSYMRGRLTLDKVNAAIDDMAAYADSNSQLIAAPKKKLAENLWEKALEVRDIAMTESVKGKHFFLETDIKDLVLRHLGRISETRIGHHRVIILLKPQT